MSGEEEFVLAAFAFEPGRVSESLQKVTQTLAPSVRNGGGCRRECQLDLR